MKTAEVLILGAGPAGLAAALELGHEALVLEKATTPGGIAATIEIGEAVFDYGGHSFHTPHPRVRELVFSSLEMYEQQRDARCYFHGSFIPYPFQKNFRNLPDLQIIKECEEGLQESENPGEPEHFEEFINNRFGDGIAKHFMLPYNRKLWGRDLKYISADWVGERVAAPEGTEERFEVRGGKRKPLQDGMSVAYPARGGFGEIFSALARRVHNLELDTEVVSIDLEHKLATTGSGEQISYGNLISTLPVPVLMQLVTSAPKALVDSVSRLDALSLKLVLVVVDHPVDTPIQRIYTADDNIPAHKIAINHNSSPWLRDRQQHGVIGEISYSRSKPFRRLDFETWMVDSLIELGIIRSHQEVYRTKMIDVPYAYPVPTHDRAAIVKEVQEWLGEHDAYTLGRFGEWAYINSDEAMARGMVLGQTLADPTPSR